MDKKRTPQDKNIPPRPDNVGPSKALLAELEDLLTAEGISLEEGKSEKGEAVSTLLDDLQETTKTPGSPSTTGSSSSSDQRPARRTSSAKRRNQERQAFQDLDVQLRSEPMIVAVAEDTMTATLSRIAGDDSYERIAALLAAGGIVFGIDHPKIREALVGASRGNPVYHLVVARGRPPRIVKKAELTYHFSTAQRNASATTKTRDFERLKQALTSHSLEALESWQGSVEVVCGGQLLSSLSPARIEPGMDVFGQPLSMEDPESLALECGENTRLSHSGSQCLAEIYGFAGLLDGRPTVLPPIWISQDHMEARFVYLPSSRPVPVPSAAELRQVLELRWIEFGIKKQALEQLPRQVAGAPSAPMTLVVAEGINPIPGKNGQLHYAFDHHGGLDWNQLQELWKLPTREALDNALAQLYARPDAPSFTAFHRGQALVERQPATPGDPGRDITGEEIIPSQGQEAALEVGDHVHLDEERLQALAACFGYACLRYCAQLCLIPPLWIAPDKTAAYFVNLPQSGTPEYPSLKEMQELLDGFQITYGFQARRWVEKLAELQTGAITDFTIPVAEALTARLGKDARFEWAIELDNPKPGKILENGSIDFRERCLTTVVEEGQLIGRLIALEPGMPGKDIFGKPLVPPPVSTLQVVTDARIYAQPESEEIIAFFAGVGGGISSKTRVKKGNQHPHRSIRLSLNPISKIERDVDYSTGNLDFNGDVLISGSIQSRFSVRATGNIIVGRHVETGAYLAAGKDILVKGGIVGAGTELVAGGEVMAHYIQEATIRAGGDVKVGSYIFNASVRAGGRVIVTGKGQRQSRAVVGGLVWGARGIIATSLGSPYNSSTRLIAGIDPHYVNRAEQLRANLQACEEKQGKILQAIGVDQLNPEQLKRQLAQCREPQKKARLLTALRHLAKIARLQQNLEGELQELVDQQRKLAFKAAITVQQKIFSGVELRFGEQLLQVQQDTARVRFHLIQQEDSLAIEASPLK